VLGVYALPQMTDDMATVVAEMREGVTSLLVPSHPENVRHVSNIPTTPPLGVCRDRYRCSHGRM